MEEKIIDGKIVRIYESIHDYVDTYGSDIADYELNWGVNEIVPADDPNFLVLGIDALKTDKIVDFAAENKLTYVNWGETEISLLPENSQRDAVYVIGDENGCWVSSAGYFQGREAAEKYHQGNIDAGDEATTTWTEEDANTVMPAIRRSFENIIARDTLHSASKYVWGIIAGYRISTGREPSPEQKQAILRTMDEISERARTEHIPGKIEKMVFGNLSNGAFK